MAIFMQDTQQIPHTKGCHQMEGDESEDNGHHDGNFCATFYYAKFLQWQ